MWFMPAWPFLRRAGCLVICREIMKDELFEGLVAIEELRQLREGERIIVPHNIEHAQTMFKLACFYLTQHDPEFKLRMSYE